MKTQLNEVRRLQKIAGILKESYDVDEESSIYEELSPKEVKVGEEYIAKMPASSDGKERVDVRVKVLGEDRNSDDMFDYVVEVLEDTDYVNPVSQQQNRYAKGDNRTVNIKYLSKA